MSVEDWVAECIEKATKPEFRHFVIEGRYPHTYACDFMRTHLEAFGLPLRKEDGQPWARSDVSAILRRKVMDDLGYPPDKEWGSIAGHENRLRVTQRQREVMIPLADAYIKEWNLRWEGDQARIV